MKDFVEEFIQVGWCNLAREWSVMGYFRQEKKGGPKRLPAIWLGKTFSNDCHGLCDRGVTLVSRSIRRLPNGFSLEMLGQVESAPWEHGLTSLGHKLVQTKKYQYPAPMPAIKAAGTPDEVGDDPPSGDEVVREGPDVFGESA